jgi:hypothetical protein
MRDLTPPDYANCPHPVLTKPVFVQGGLLPVCPYSRSYEIFPSEAPEFWCLKPFHFDAAAAFRAVFWSNASTSDITFNPERNASSLADVLIAISML